MFARQGEDSRGCRITVEFHGGDHGGVPDHSLEGVETRIKDGKSVGPLWLFLFRLGTTALGVAAHVSKMLRGVRSGGEEAEAKLFGDVQTCRR